MELKHLLNRLRRAVNNSAYPTLVLALISVAISATLVLLLRGIFG